MQLKRVKEWLEHNAKIWSFRLIVLTSILVTTLSALGLYPLSTNAVLVFMLGLFLIFAEIFFGEIVDVRRTIGEGVVLDWNSSIRMFHEDARRGKKMTIIARSGETFYYTLRDIFLDHGSRINLDLVLTRCKEDPEDFASYQIGWITRWQELAEQTGANIRVDVVNAVLEVQCLIIDDDTAYLSYREQPHGPKAVPLRHLRVGSRSNQGQFLIGLYRSWIARHRAVSEVSTLEGVPPREATRIAGPAPGTSKAEASHAHSESNSHASKE
jgi:hypothetical protein